MKNNPIHDWPLLCLRIQSCLALSVIGIVVYANHLMNPFQFDTVAYIFNNPQLRYFSEGFGWEFWVTQFNARALLRTSFAANYLMDEHEPFGYHLLNLYLHIINTLLIFFVTLNACRHFKFHQWGFSKGSMKQQAYISLFAALLFLIHPIQTESVIYVMSRSEVFSATFYLSAFLLFQRIIDRDNRRGMIDRVFCIILIAALGIIGYTVKQTLATMPLMLLIYYLCGCPPDSKPIRLLDKWKWVIGLALAIGLSVLFVKLFSDEQFLTGPSKAGEIIGRKAYMLSQPGVIVFYYLKLLLFPFNLNIDPEIEKVTQIFSVNFWLSSLIILSLIFISARIKGSKVFLFLILWFFIVLSPSSSIVTLHDLAAEHRVYLASYGFFFLVSIGIIYGIRHASSRKNPRLYTTILCLLIASLLLMGMMTIKRNSVWKSELSLWTDTYKKSPDKVRPLINLARSYSIIGDKGRSIDLYEKALNLLPYDFVTNYNLGDLYQKKGRHEEALNKFLLARRLKPDNPEVNAKLGEIYLAKKESELSRKFLKKAVELNPRNPVPLRNLGILHYFHLAKPEEGLAYFKRSLYLDPDQPEAENIRRLFEMPIPEQSEID